MSSKYERNFHTIGFATSKTSLDLAQHRLHTPLEALEVAVHMTYEQYWTPQISKSSSSISREGSLNDTPA
jgi:hypothetical protein